jgi:hypothetical protein
MMKCLKSNFNILFEKLILKNITRTLCFFYKYKLVLNIKPSRKTSRHFFRLLQSAAQILATGNLNIKVTNREELLAIKAGAMEYDALLQKADDLIETIEQLYKTSTLPETPDVEKAIKVLIGMREALYK